MSLTESSPEIRRMTDLLYKECRKLRRGDVLTHDRIEQLTGMDRHVHPWQLVINHHLRRRMIEDRGITIDNVLELGYKLLTVDEEMKYGAKCSRRARRRLRRGAKHLSLVPDVELTDHQMRARNFQVDQMQESIDQLSANDRAMARILSEPVPPEQRRPHPNEFARAGDRADIR